VFGKRFDRLDRCAARDRRIAGDDGRFGVACA
jgi:hypothetical protein